MLNAWLKSPEKTFLPPPSFKEVPPPLKVGQLVKGKGGGDNNLSSFLNPLSVRRVSIDGPAMLLD